MPACSTYRQTGFGDMSHDQNLASMRRFGEEVMPAFRT
jgi:hypothetical protein